MPVHEQYQVEKRSGAADPCGNAHLGYCDAGMASPCALAGWLAKAGHRLESSADGRSAGALGNHGFRGYGFRKTRQSYHIRTLCLQPQPDVRGLDIDIFGHCHSGEYVVAYRARPHSIAGDPLLRRSTRGTSTRGEVWRGISSISFTGEAIFMKG